VYLIWKAVHVFGVVLFLGNIITGVFWAALARKARDPKVIAQTFEGITKSDRWFTMPGVTLLTLAGVANAIIAGIPMLSTGWIFWSIVLLIISGVAFMFRVSPLQRRIAALARAGGSGQFEWARYELLYRSWALWGSIATLAPLVALVLMVLKPDLPGLGVTISD
jgi:uncharacterized membrane protein